MNRVQYDSILIGGIAVEFKKMRRRDKELPPEVAKKILRNGSFGVLSTADAKGIPYGVPVNYVYVDNVIYVHSAIVGHKLQNIASNSDVSFCVVQRAEVIPEKFSTDYRSAIAFGRAIIVQDSQEKVDSLKKLVAKYSADFLSEGAEEIDASLDVTAVIRIDILHLTGKGSGED